MATIEEDFKQLRAQFERLRAAIPVKGPELDMRQAEAVKALLAYAEAGLASLDLEVICRAPEGPEMLAQAVKQLDEFTTCLERVVAARGGMLN